MRPQHPRLPVLVALMLLGSSTPGAAQPASQLEAQRAAFRAVFPEAELGNWQPALEQETVLRDYVLWPDLRAAYLRATMHTVSDAKVIAYLDHYGTIKPARELRYHYSLKLAADDRLADYLEIYRQFYRGLGVARLDCIALQAEIEAGRSAGTAKRATELWLVGSSQKDECDSVFEYLHDAGVLGTEEYEQRFALAIAARQFSLARYLSAPLAPEYRQQASGWLEAQKKPTDFLQRRGQEPDGQIQRQQLVYAIERIALRDPAQAAQHWTRLSPRYAFSEQQAAGIERHIALWAARRHLPQAVTYLQKLPATAIDTEVQRWMVRSNLRQQDWKSALLSITTMPPDEQVAEQWRYWRAVTLAQLNRNDEAKAIFLSLAAERSYYGFLAADELGAKYAFSHQSMPAEEAAIEELSLNAALVRARELFMVGLEGRGRSEWDAAVGNFNASQKAQAAILAHRWGWHSRAIATAATVGHFDDLRIRYPLPYAKAFNRYSADAKIEASWAYGIARSESLFMRDIRSSAGAIGVMQLLPETGRKTARRINYPYAGRVTLTNPESNIRLGTVYLGQMLERFDENRVLATAAYNAGPLNVKAWLPDHDNLDARVWIENIPFNETRKYVRRVLETDAIFHWRMTGKVRRISSELPMVLVGQESGKVARVD